MKKINYVMSFIKIFLIVVPTIIGSWLYLIKSQKKTVTIKVGILHSSTGTMGQSENSVIDATLFAIDELNEQGGLLGKLIEPLIVDGMSSPTIFAQQAESLIKENNVEVIFGCWTSSSRKAVKKVVEKYNKLLFYPVQFEGLEESNNIIYLGATANQQIIPAVTLALQQNKRRFFLIGSDYIYSHAAHELIKKYCTKFGGEVVGEIYIPLGSHEVYHLIDAINTAKPDVIFNTVNGDTNISLFRNFTQADITASKIPIFSFSVSPSHMAEIGFDNLIGHYIATSYLQDIAQQKNKSFLINIRKQFGSEKVINAADQNAYVGVHLWAQAVEEAQSFDTQKLKSSLKDRNINAPEGALLIEAKTGYCWKMMRIGQIEKDGSIQTIWNSEKPLKPEPFPAFKTHDEWNDFLNHLYKKWGEQWENPKPMKA